MPASGDCANPLLAQWMKERWDLARERGTKDKVIYKRAYESLKKCPVTFAHPSETVSLDGIGPKLADWLCTKMEEYCDANGLPRPKKSKGILKRRSEVEEATRSAAEVLDEDHRPKRAKTRKQYIPKPRSGPYALLLALSAQSQLKRGMAKADLQREAQQYCDSSFTVPSDPTKYFTAWNSMKTLIEKELVCMVGGGLKLYMLTEEGGEVAQQLRIAAGMAEPPTRPATISLRQGANSLIVSDSLAGTARPNFSPPLNNGNESSPEPGDPVGDDTTIARWDTTFPRFEPIMLPAGSFSVEMVLDNREVRTQSDRDYISVELQKLGVNPVTRPLKLGDAVWVAKINPSYLENVTALNVSDDAEFHDEIMLDSIMERKRLDDLIYSIKDGRFREQKYRLRRSGVPNVVYTIEAYSISEERKATYIDSVESAIVSMQLINGYFVKQTAKLDETVQYLADMTKALKTKYEQQNLPIIPTSALGTVNFPVAMNALREERPNEPHYITFSAFDAMCGKSELTIRDTYLKMLMCIRGITGDKAIEIQRRWPTPLALIQAYDACANEDEKKKLISSQLAGLISKKKVAKIVSSKVAEVWA